MSFMTKVKAPEVNKLQSKFVELKDAKKFPDGKHYFILGIGDVNKNTSTNVFWDDSAVGENAESIRISYSSFWAERTVDGAQKPIELKWITNQMEDGSIAPNDPAVLLGLTNRDDALHRKVYPRTSPKIKKIANMPSTTVWIPVFKLQSQLTKKSNLQVMPTDGEIIHLGLSASTYQKVLDASKRIVETLQDENPNALGRMFTFEINRTAKPADMYKIEPSPIILQNGGLNEFTALMAQERNNIIEYINDRTFERINGGETGNEGAEYVWNFICDTLGMTKQQVIARYFVGKRQSVNPEATESIDFGTMETTTAQESFDEEES